MPTYRNRVLLVDDDQAVRKSLKFVLELEGLDVDDCDGAESLLAQPSLAHADCLILDDQMPGLTGLEVMDRLAARRVTIPTVMITSHASADLRRRAERARIRYVLEKPLADSALADAVRTILKNSVQSHYVESPRS